MVRRIVSGGQTGADRAALDVALELGLDVGGWIPRGRWTEDGPLPDRYPNFRETESADPSDRTALNVRDADATLIVSHGTLTGGSLLTQRIATRLGKPVLHLDLEASDEDAAAATLERWLADTRPQTLNVAGPRHSRDPAIFDATARLLRRVLARAEPG
jgi:putative molybdenum carrier protein